MVRFILSKFGYAKRLRYRKQFKLLKSKITKFFPFLLLSWRPETRNFDKILANTWWVYTMTSSVKTYHPNSIRNSNFGAIWSNNRNGVILLPTCRRLGIPFITNNKNYTDNSNESNSSSSSGNNKTYWKSCQRH